MDLNIESFTNLITGKLTHWIESLIQLLPNIILAALILVLGLIVSKLAKKTSLRIISKFSHSLLINKLFVSVVYLTFIWHYDLYGSQHFKFRQSSNINTRRSRYYRSGAGFRISGYRF
ncbi:MAG: hypothetical protein ABI462_13930 [Ignavibacteria bacterium]